MFFFYAWNVYEISIDLFQYKTDNRVFGNKIVLFLHWSCSKNRGCLL